MFLDGLTKSMEVVLGEGVTAAQCDITASYVDISRTGFAVANVSSLDTVSNSTTPVTVIPAPLAGVSRQVKEITVYNADSADHQIAIQLNNNSDIRVILSQNIAPLDTLIYRPDALQGPAGETGATGPVGPAAGSTGTPADFGYFFSGRPLSSHEVALMYLTRNIALPASLTGSYFVAMVAPTLLYTFTFEQNGVSIGSVDFAAGTGVPTVTFAAPVNLVVGDSFEIIGQGVVDATIQDISFNFAATFA